MEDEAPRLRPIRSTEQVEEENVAAWKDWLATLSPDEIAAIDRLGLKAPEPPRRGRRQRRDDPVDDEVGLGNCEHVAGHESLEPDEALMAREETIDEGKRRELVLLTVTLPHISDANDARLEASILALALKIGARQGITSAGLSETHRVEFEEIQRGVRSWELRLDVCRADVELLKYVIAPILASRSPGLEAEAFARAARIGISNAARMEDAGLKHGVCRQAISRRVRQRCQDLSTVTGCNFPLPRECKRNTDKYRLFNVRRQATDPFK